MSNDFLEFHKEKWMPEPMSGCFLWFGSSNRLGYGVVFERRFEYGKGQPKKQFLAHRRSFESANGPVAPGLCVCHKCDTPSCVNPDHLYAGTHTQNMADKKLRGRVHRPAGEKNPKAKLTPAIVQYIRLVYKTGQGPILAKMFGVTPPSINNIAAGRTWG